VILVLVVGLAMNAIALPLAALRVSFLYRVIRSGQPAPDRIAGVTSRVGAAIKRQVVEIFGQRKLLKWSVPGAAHFFVFWAFLILATVYLEAYGSLLKILFTGGDGPMDWAIPVVGHWPVLGFAQDFIAMMALFGIATFVWIRVRNAPKDLGRRMGAMRKTVADNDVAHWASAFLSELTTARPAHDKHVRPASGT